MENFRPNLMNTWNMFHDFINVYEHVNGMSAMKVKLLETVS